MLCFDPESVAASHDHCCCSGQIKPEGESTEIHEQLGRWAIGP
jgi:hypothetical protein